MARHKQFGKIRILFINTEVDPYLTTGDLSELGRKLPQAMEDNGHEARIFTPRFGVVNERRNQLHEVIRLSGQNIIVNETDRQLILKVASLMPQRIQVYFIENEEYFTTKKVYGEKAGEEYEDQMERCLFFVRGVAETVKKLRWTPDVIYCQGWFAALAPVIFKKATVNSCFRNVKIVYALFNNDFKKSWPASTSRIIKIPGITKADVAEIRDKHIDCKMLTRFAIKYSDGVIVTDPNIDPEILDYARETGKSILDVSDSKELDVAAYNQYFESFCPPTDIPVEE